MAESHNQAESGPCEPQTHSFDDSTFDDPKVCANIMKRVDFDYPMPDL
jgi:hypothetical protein